MLWRGPTLLSAKKSCLRGIDERECKTERLAVIDGRTLSQERIVGTQSGRVNGIGFSSVNDCRTTADQGARVDAILYNIGAAHPSSEGVGDELRKLVEEASPIPVIVIMETEISRSCWKRWTAALTDAFPPASASTYCSRQ